MEVMEDFPNILLRFYFRSSYLIMNIGGGRRRVGQLLAQVERFLKIGRQSVSYLVALSSSSFSDLL